jgi:hypothetical protein
VDVGTGVAKDLLSAMFLIEYGESMSRNYLWGVLVMGAVLVNTAWAAGNPGWTTFQTVVAIQGGDAGVSEWIYLRQGSQINPQYCGNSSYYIMETTTSNFHRNRLAILMAAYLKSKKAKLFLNGCSSNGYPIINQVEVDDTQ